MFILCIGRSVGIFIGGELKHFQMAMLLDLGTCGNLIVLIDVLRRSTNIFFKPCAHLPGCVDVRSHTQRKA